MAAPGTQMQRKKLRERRTWAHHSPGQCAAASLSPAQAGASDIVTERRPLSPWASRGLTPPKKSFPHGQV
eukprot:3291966-Pyramimonas_sp.AAC.1